MNVRAPLLVAGAFGIAALVHAVDGASAPDACERARADANGAPPEGEVLDFLFAPASAWRHYAQEQQLDAMARQASGAGR